MQKSTYSVTFRVRKPWVVSSWIRLDTTRGANTVIGALIKSIIHDLSTKHVTSGLWGKLP